MPASAGSRSAGGSEVAEGPSLSGDGAPPDMSGVLISTGVALGWADSVAVAVPGTGWVSPVPGRSVPAGAFGSSGPGVALAVRVAVRADSFVACCQSIRIVPATVARARQPMQETTATANAEALVTASNCLGLVRIACRSQCAISRIKRYPCVFHYTTLHRFCNGVDRQGFGGASQHGIVSRCKGVSAAWGPQPSDVPHLWTGGRVLTSVANSATMRFQLQCDGDCLAARQEPEATTKAGCMPE
jgi:hypothetical protein